MLLIFQICTIYLELTHLLIKLTKMDNVMHDFFLIESYVMYPVAQMQLLEKYLRNGHLGVLMMAIVFILFS